MTHPIRQELLSAVHDKSGVLIQAFEWQETVSDKKADLFKYITQRSIFSLCPRGYGATSYRLYESIQLGAIPVYVSDKHLLPWNDEINWEDFCIIIKPKDIEKVIELTLGITNNKVKIMQKNLENIWKNYFSIESSCRHIAKKLKNSL